MAPRSQNEHLNPSTAGTPQKVTASFWGNEIKYQTLFFSPGRGHIYEIHLQKMAGKPSTWPQQWPKQFAPLYVRPEPPPR